MDGSNGYPERLIKLSRRFSAMIPLSCRGLSASFDERHHESIKTFGLLKHNEMTGFGPERVSQVRKCLA
jgi:hypothetical protein